jgi:hypothetical protein
VSYDCPSVVTELATFGFDNPDLKYENSMPGQFRPKVDPAGNTIQGIKFNSPKGFLFTK